MSRSASAPKEVRFISGPLRPGMLVEYTGAYLWRLVILGERLASNMPYRFNYDVLVIAGKGPVPRKILNVKIPLDAVVVEESE